LYALHSFLKGVTTSLLHGADCVLVQLVLRKNNSNFISILPKRRRCCTFQEILVVDEAMTVFKLQTNEQRIGFEI
jgi:hypothetical protein